MRVIASTVAFRCL